MPLWVPGVTQTPSRVLGFVGRDQISVWPGAGISSVSFSDDFNRADGALGANWGTTQGTIAIVSNVCRFSANGARNVVFWSADTPDEDQFAQATCVTEQSTTSASAGVVVRHNGGTSQVTASYYGFSWRGDSDTWTLSKVVLGSASALTTAGGGPTTLIGAGPLRLEVSGTSTVTLTGYLNGSQVITTTDSSSPLSGGTAGLQAFDGSPVWEFDDFSGGDL
jgi:hypothetical protein